MHMFALLRKKIGDLTLKASIILKQDYWDSPNTILIHSSK